MAKHTLDDRKSSIHSPKRSLLRKLPYMVAAGLAEVALLAGLESCNPTPSVTPTSTEKPAITSTYTPEAPTYTPSPTLEPITLTPFSAQLEGVGSNGTLACFTYNGNAADLDNLTLAANISQGGTRVESDIPAEQIDGKTCFELVDARYVSVSPTDGTLIIPEGSVALQLNATSPDGRQVLNNNQTLDLGKYVQFPFLGWIYDTTQVCKNNAHIDSKTNTPFVAWDFVPYPTAEHQTLVNTPLLSPTEGIIYTIRDADTSSGTNTSVMIYNLKTGYLIDLTHNATVFVAPDGKFVLQSLQMGKSVIMGDTIAMIGEKDESSGMPHTHMELIIPSSEIDLSMDPSKLAITLRSYFLNKGGEIDFIASHLFLNEAINNYLSNLPNSASACGKFTWGTLPTPPSQLPITIDGKAGDWAGYTPVLTDASGDSQTGNVMDFTELYTAKDDNYLYFMVKLGTPPAIQNWYSIFLDTNAENQCGAADKLIQISPLDPTGFPYGSLSGCGEGTDTKQYSGGSFVMGQVFEGKIPLLYLGELDHLEIVKIIGNTYDGSTIASPDTMP